jgi:hypothetical protein
LVSFAAKSTPWLSSSSSCNFSVAALSSASNFLFRASSSCAFSSSFKLD